MNYLYQILLDEIGYLKSISENGSICDKHNRYLVRNGTIAK